MATRKAKQQTSGQRQPYGKQDDKRPGQRRAPEPSGRRQSQRDVGEQEDVNDQLMEEELDAGENEEGEKT